MKTRSYSSLLVAAIFAAASLASARAEETVNTIKFTDPAKPGTLKINLGRGDLQIQGADTTEVSVKSDAKAITAKPRKDGLRVISASTSFGLGEKDNVVTLDAMSDSGKSSGDFKITVPRNTTILVQNSWGGDFSASNISGDIEINSMHGEIRLEDVAGGVVAGTMNGEIRASIRELHDGKPLSFTSMNGEVVLRLPVNMKASVRLRTQNGSVLTDFEDTALVTKTEAAPLSPRGKYAYTYKGGPRGLNADIQEAIREATQISAVAVRQALEAVKEGIDSARIDSDEARRQLDDARRQLDSAERERDRATRRDGRVTDETAPPAPPAAAMPAAAPKPATAPKAPMMPKIAAPTISGGKLVTGTLNGGGPEISVATMNGDVILRQLDGKK